MADDRNGLDPRTAWQDETVSPLRMSPEQIRRKAEGMNRRLRYMLPISLFIVMPAWAATFLWVALNDSEPLQRAGAVLVFGGVLYMIYRTLALRRAMLKLRQETQAQPSIAFLHGMLRLFSEYGSGKGFWKAWFALYPAAMVFTLGGGLADGGEPHGLGYLPFVVVAVISVAIVPVNLRKMRRMQRRLEQLDGSEA